jgi:hypothetical protein
MKIHRILSSILLCTATGVPLLGQQAKSAEDVIAEMLDHDAMRERASGGYTGDRKYVLENHGLHKGAEMLVQVDCQRDGTKHFEVLSEGGWEAASRHVLREMLAAESDDSHPDMRSKSRITSDNYAFRMVAEGFRVEGRATYVIDVIPKRQEKTLFRGRVWVDAEDYAIVRVEGEPARNPSFWTRRVHFVQQYRKNGDFWFPAMTTSVTDARMFGATDVNIRYFDYKPVLAAPAGRPDSTSTEAYSERH